VHFVVSTLLLLVALLVVAPYVLEFISSNTGTGSAWLFDDRSFIISEMASDFKPMDWLIGRGAFGTYYSPYFADLVQGRVLGGDFYLRQTVEAGYLQYVLKLGLIGAVMFALIGTVAIFRSVFQKEDLVSRAIGVLICARLAGSFVGFASSFSPETVVFWLLVGVALSERQNKVFKAHTSSCLKEGAQVHILSTRNRA